MTTDHTDTTRLGTGSLLDDETTPAASGPRTTLITRARAGASAWCRGAIASPRARWMLGASAGMLAVSAALAAHATLAPRPDPDDLLAETDRLFDRVLLSDAFNDLPLDERIDLIASLVERVRGMGGNDSALLAAFASKIEGAARDQLIENASRIVVDLMDEAGRTYDPTASKADRERQIESSVVEMMRAVERMTGEGSDKTDEELLEDAREQAGRDARQMRSDDFSSDDAGQAFTFISTTIGNNTTAVQKARMAGFSRDMARVLRGRDVETGERKRQP